MCCFALISNFGCDNDHRMAKSIENSIGFAAKRQVWQRMILKIIRPMLIAMRIWQNSYTVLLRGEKLFRFSPSYTLSKEQQKNLADAGKEHAIQ